MLHRGRELALDSYFRSGALALLEEAGFGLALLVRELVVGIPRHRTRVTDVLGAGCGANEPFGGRARILHELLHSWQESYRLRVAQTRNLQSATARLFTAQYLAMKGALATFSARREYTLATHMASIMVRGMCGGSLPSATKAQAGRLQTSAGPQSRSSSLASRLTVHHVARAMVRICRALDRDTSRDIAGVRPTEADHVVRFGVALADLASKHTTEFANDRSADTLRGGARLLDIYRDETAASATGGG